MQIGLLLRAVLAAIFSRAVSGSRSGFLSSALNKVHREAAQARLLVFRLHVGPGLAHGGDDAVQRDPMAPVATHLQRRGGERFTAPKALRRGTIRSTTVNLQIRITDIFLPRTSHRLMIERFWN
jgi:hypothetical protein